MSITKILASASTVRGLFLLDWTGRSAQLSFVGVCAPSPIGKRQIPD